jgi:lactate dehydrogenase-like 2-hydroxyacid dehydrogenase
MAIKVVVLDSRILPEGVDFPPLDADKYGWEQYPQLQEGEIAERCWRADIVVSLDTPIGSPQLEKMVKIGLLICAGPACDRIDQAALAGHGVELLAFPDARLDEKAEAQDLCDRVAAAINHYVRNYEAGGAVG